jgi:hypothetical protein
VLGMRLCVPPEYDPGHHVVGVEVEVKNVSPTALILVTTAAMLIDGEGRQYRRMNVNPVGVSGQLDTCEPELTGLPARPLPPGEKQRGFIDVFMTQLDAEDFRVRFEIFTEAEWLGPAADAEPVAIEVPVGSLDERSAWRAHGPGPSEIRRLLLPPPR